MVLFASNLLLKVISLSVVKDSLILESLAFVNSCVQNV